MPIGEAALENPLPWDTLPVAPVKAPDDVQQLLAALRTRSAARTDGNPYFERQAAQIREIALVQSGSETCGPALPPGTRAESGSSSSAGAGHTDEVLLEAERILADLAVLLSSYP
jgi:hypothetical protein